MDCADQRVLSRGKETSEEDMMKSMPPFWGVSADVIRGSKKQDHRVNAR